MKFAYIVHARMPTERAHGLQIASMCSALIAQGHEVTLVVPYRKNTIAKSVSEYYGLANSVVTKHLWVPDVIGLLGWTHIPFIHYLHSVLFLLRLLFYRPGGDVCIYTRTPEIAWLYTLRGYKVICEIHDWPEGYTKLFVYFLRKVTLLPTNSEGTKEACNAHGLMQTIVAHNGIDPSMFEKELDRTELRTRLGINVHASVALYIGALEAWKGAHILAESSEYLSDSWKVVIIGGRESEIAVLKAQYPKVLFLGARPYAELGENQQSADVLVVPNIPVTKESREYTSPIKLFAHMASFIPVVASDLPSLRRIVSSEEVFFVPPGDAHALADMFEYIRTHRDDASKRARKARDIALMHTWEARVRSIIDAYTARTR